MNKEYFVAKDKLVVMDEQGNIDIRNRMNNPKEILEQEIESIRNQIPRTKRKAYFK